MPSRAPIGQPRRSGKSIRIAVARDSAFGFYYADDLEAFERAGAKLCFFDALSDSRLPEADGLFIGGGFPETQAAALEANAGLRADIARKIRAGLPTYAECGGLMYLARSIQWKGASHQMVGVIPADAVMHDRPQGRGLVLLQETEESPWPAMNAPEAEIPAHEFHYAALENLSDGQRFAYRMARGEGMGRGQDGIVIGNLLASFSHLRSSPGNPWVERFVTFVSMHRQGRAQAASICADAPLALHL
jgi:cobyrinic acid a,c-diamide synthase